MKIRLDIESLRAMKAVATAGSVTRAAVKLNLTQSAVSHKIKRLEERIGRPIFLRTDGSLIITEDGAHLLNYAERLVGVHDEAVALFSRNELSGHIRLGVTQDVTGSGIARVLARFSMVYPNVSLVSRVAHSLILNNQLRRGEIDLALMQLFEEELLEEDRILWWDDVIWVQSEDFEEAGNGSLPFIAFHERCFYRTWAAEVLNDTRRSLSLVLVCPSVEGVADAVRSGLGLALINRRNLRPGCVEAGIALPKPPRVVYVARSAIPNPSEIVVTLRDAIEDELLESTT
ncbi:MAG: LysR family transcriptional regulator [Gammaproteobacteria bacterium]|jgi:DNA-binding transcriptional LysR family regulator|nr:LysR family transcriptional regulator [Gammaproteobacteria bacterium]